MKTLLADLPHRWLGPDRNPAVGGVSYDSRRVRAGDLYVALKGQKQDGHDFAADVVNRGAVAVVAERPLAVNVPVIVVPSALEALSVLSARFYENPSGSLTVVGVTGTNGKTTTTYMLESILKEAKRACGVIGTVEYRWLAKKEKAANTTPFSADLERLLSEMKKDGVSHVVMEVSSHALALHRVDDIDFSAAVFTNLTRDHLDFHKSMDEYFEAKAKLFRLLSGGAAGRPGARKKIAIINVDDDWSSTLRTRVKAHVLTYGLKKPADLRAENVFLNAQGTAFDLVTADGRVPCRLRTVGLHNVYNALAAAATAAGMGFDVPVIQRGLAALAGVPGRLERVGPAAFREGRPSIAPETPVAPFGVFVDYAHTDDALKNVLLALRPLTGNRLITVFGCGGDRDRTKRPLMGEVAVTLSDYVIVTSDNPRSEDPQKVALDIEVGIRRAGGSRYETVLDREAAIEKALRMARKDDVVLIAGKGHETYQIFKDRTIDFDDREVVRRILGRLFAAGNG